MLCANSPSRLKRMPPESRPRWPIAGESRREAMSMHFLRAALHKLSQPLTAALWINELQTSQAKADTGTVSPQSTLANELERAVMFLNFLRELLEEQRNVGPCDSLPIRKLIEVAVSAQVGSLPLAARVSRFAVSDRFLCLGNRFALQRVLGFMLETLAGAAPADGRLEICAQRRGAQVELRFTVPSVCGERWAAEFARQANPFEDPSLPGPELPKAARMLALVEEMGGGLRAEGGPSTLMLVLGLRLTDHIPVRFPILRKGITQVQA